MIPGRRMQACTSGGCRHALREDAGMLFGRMQACTSGGCRHTLQEDAGMLFAGTRRIFLKTLQQAGGMYGNNRAAEPATPSARSFLFDHAGKYGTVRR